MNEADEAELKKASKAVFQRLGDGSIFSLNWPQQVVALIYSAQGVIDNGGFEFFFENDWPDQPPYSVFADAYRAIGADECAECIEVAASLFPFPDPHRAEADRRAYLEEHCEDDDFTLGRLGVRVIEHSDANFTLLAQYVRMHLAEIRNA
jgi:hypothetical protein